MVIYKNNYVINTKGSSITMSKKLQKCLLKNITIIIIIIIFN